MKYKDILKEIATNRKISTKEVEKEMEAAIKCAGLDCSPKEFIENAVAVLKERTIYSKTV